MKLENLSKRYSHCTFAVEMLLTGVPIDRFIACSVPCLGDVVLPTTPLPSNDGLVWRSRPVVSGAHENHSFG
jgi:hypothetical protein